MDNVTLAAANAFLNAYCGANLLIAASQRRSRPLQFAGFAFLELAIGFAAVVIFADAPPATLAIVFNLAFSLFFFLYFACIRAFAGLPPWPARYSILLTLGYTVLTLTVILIPQSFPRIAVTSGLVVALFADLTGSLRRQLRALPRLERALSLAALTGYPLYLLLRLVVIYRQAYADKFFTDASLESTVSQLFMMVNFGVLATVANLIDNHQLMHNLGRKDRLLEQQAILDPLTGLYNEQYLRQHISREMIRIRHQKKHLSAICLDIDGFRQINERHGFFQGNRVLLEVTALLRSFFREHPIMVRLAGARFLILLPEAGLENALILAENLRYSIETQPRPAVCAYTASLGVAEYELGEAPDHFLERAETALDLARENGRNRVVPAT